MRSLSPRTSVSRARTTLALVLLGASACGDVDVDDGDLAPAPGEGVEPDDALGRSPDAPATADGGGAAASPDARAGDAGEDAAAAPPEPEFDAVPWEQGGDVGFGVARKDTGNPRGESAALLYAGYEARLDAAKAWARELYRADLRARGVRWLYAVQGPATIQYTGLEIGNSNVLAHLVPRVTDRTRFVLVLGHSSGSYVAHEMLRQAAARPDAQGKTSGRLVYFNLDGGRAGFTDAVAATMRKTWWVSPRDVAKGTPGFNAPSMQSAGAAYASLGGLLPYDASRAGCNAGATGCVHNSLVITRPHSPARARPDLDYEQFAGRPVTTSFLTEKAAEAGLSPAP